MFNLNQIHWTIYFPLFVSSILLGCKEAAGMTAMQVAIPIFIGYGFAIGVVMMTIPRYISLSSIPHLTSLLIGFYLYLIALDVMGHVAAWRAGVRERSELEAKSNEEREKRRLNKALQVPTH